MPCSSPLFFDLRHDVPKCQDTHVLGKYATQHWLYVLVCDSDDVALHRFIQTEGHCSVNGNFDKTSKDQNANTQCNEVGLHCELSRQCMLRTQSLQDLLPYWRGILRTWILGDRRRSFQSKRQSSEPFHMRLILTSSLVVLQTHINRFWWV